MRDAILWLHGNGSEGHFDPANIHVTGHSAGDHLTAELAAMDWRAHGLPRDLTQSAT
ncbi:MAG: esterase, partial [Rhodospirillaceae bacterium]|nr:esterase [Rhodospirillaceae bacterium]